MLYNCLQLKEDTIALAAGAVTAMLAANAAAAGPMDSPEKVRPLRLACIASQLCLPVLCPPQSLDAFRSRRLIHAHESGQSALSDFLMSDNRSQC